MSSGFKMAMLALSITSDKTNTMKYKIKINNDLTSISLFLPHYVRNNNK